MDRRPIGIFDSGLGGLTVVRRLTALLPQEDIVYFGDTGRVPYGTRSPETIRRYARQDCALLESHGVKRIIAACGTVSSVAPSVLAEAAVPAVGIVEPTAEAALAATRNGKIGLLGTTATVRSGAFARYMAEKQPAVQLFAQDCPLLVSLVECGWIDKNDPVTRAAAERYLRSLTDEGVDTVILGCTHFPLLAPVFADLLGEEVTLIDSGAACAAACAKALQDGSGENDSAHRGTLRFFVSDRPHDFTRVAEMFLGRSIDPADVSAVEVER